MIPRLIVCMLCCLVGIATCEDDPYAPGQYDVGVYVIDPKTHGAPLHSSVYYPIAAKTFDTITYIGGFNGFMVAEMYSDFLKNVASRGYVVIGMDPIYIKLKDSKSLKFESFIQSKNPRILTNGLEGKDKYLAQINWLQNNLLNASSAVLDWSALSFMCQSSGCDVTLKIMKENPDWPKAALFFDPVSVYSLGLKPFKSSIKFLAHMSELSEHFPTCCIPGIGWKRIYELMECTRVRLETDQTGHCDMLDRKWWAACEFVGLCRTTGESHLARYQNFLGGLTHAFLEWTVQGQASMQKYVTNTTYMPFPITQLYYDTNC